MYTAQRRQMVARQLAARGIKSPVVLHAMDTIPREDFVPAELKDCAYEDNPLHICEGQTISQPYVVALMMEALDLKPTSVVLDVGTCTGYTTALFSSVAKEVHSVERVPALVEFAKRNLKPYANTHVYLGDGTRDLWQEEKKFDAISVAAGAPAIPQNLVNMLNEGGKIVIPVGETVQTLVVGTKQEDGKLKVKPLCGVRFVPLIGEQGF